MWIEFQSAVSCRLPKEVEFKHLWDDFVVKINNKVSIENGNKLAEVKKRHEEGKTIYSDEISK